MGYIRLFPRITAGPEMVRTKPRLLLCGVFLAAILAFIWGNSLLSADASRAFSDWVQSFLRIADGTASGQGSGLLRKAAHFTEFCALGICLSWLFAMLRKGSLWPLALGIGAGCVDETIQCFVPGRGPGILDVAIDTAGVAVGICLLMLCHRIYTRKTKHNYGGK